MKNTYETCPEDQRFIVGKEKGTASNQRFSTVDKEKDRFMPWKTCPE
jgi:hypothetical protein